MLATGGEVIGVIPQALVERELAHEGLTQLHVVGYLHERKAMMAELADAFVALPGGFGTLDELMEQLTWSQLGLHTKPVGLLDVEGYWRPLVASRGTPPRRASSGRRTSPRSPSRRRRRAARSAGAARGLGTAAPQVVGARSLGAEDDAERQCGADRGGGDQAAPGEDPKRRVHE